jgi:hypothetical protein
MRFFSTVVSVGDPRSPEAKDRRRAMLSLLPCFVGGDFVEGDFVEGEFVGGDFVVCVDRAATLLFASLFFLLPLLLPAAPPETLRVLACAGCFSVAIDRDC